MRRMFVAISLLALMIAARAEAQEVQVPFDDAGRVEVVDAALAQRLGLFVDEYPGFVEARLFRGADQGLSLEVLVRRDGQVVRQRRPLTTAEAATLRERFAAQVRERAPEVGRTQEGRDLLLAQTSLTGLLFYGPAVTTLTGAEGSAAVGTYMLTTGASFFLPFVLTQDQSVTYGMANLARYGGTRGALHGLLLRNLAGGPDYDSDDRSQAFMALAGSIGEGVAGFHWAKNERMTSGHAAAIGLGGDLGLAWGISTGLLTLGDEADELGSLLALGGSAAGIYAGHRLGGERGFTWGDVTMMYTAGALGAYTALSALAAAGAEDERPYAAGVMLGSGAGVWYANRLVRGKDFSVGQATLVELGTVAGALTGLGIVAMTGAEDEDPYLLGSALGGALGYGLTYAMQSGEAARRGGERMSSSLRLHLTPAALLMARGEASRSEARPAVAFATVQYRF